MKCAGAIGATILKDVLDSWKWLQVFNSGSDVDLVALG